MPLTRFAGSYRAGLQEESTRLARFFKVSTLVILRRLHDAGVMICDDLWQACNAEAARLQATAQMALGAERGWTAHMNDTRIGRPVAALSE
jgi:hypothetical protein